MGLMKDNLCWKCMNVTGSYLHLLWDCPQVFPFLETNHFYLKDRDNTAIPPSEFLSDLTAFVMKKNYFMFNGDF